MASELFPTRRFGRRALMASSIASSLQTLAACDSPSRSRAKGQITLWPYAPPGGGGPSGPEVVTARGALHSVTEPRLEICRPRRPNGSAVLIAAGGGYHRIGMQREGYSAARWLAACGVTSFILVYRLPCEGWLEGPLAPLHDARRALALIRKRARAEQIEPDRVTLLGFSAGGHLMGMLATLWQGEGALAPIVEDETVLRPAGVALIYPVITLEKPLDHTATRRNLIGANPDKALARRWSVHTHVTSGYPALFLTHADNDRIVHPDNAALMAKTCRAVGTSVDYHRLPSGGHGFGMGDPGHATSQWPGWYEGWLNRLGMI